MVVVLSTKCPYCSENVFFPSGVESGYCSSCGKIIYTEGAIKLSVTIRPDSGSERPEARILDDKCQLSIVYLKRTASGYNTSVEVTIEGPENKHLILQNGVKKKIALTKGMYTINAKCHHRAGLNSQDVYGTMDVNLIESKRIRIVNGPVMYSPSLLLEYA